uniref:SFRICE_013123 n=1 Tax=Spodoptera frugiperda TaxID=7108 RepID=A0A2H1W881_SPOFR
MNRLLLLLTCAVGVWTFKLESVPSCGLEASSNLVHHNPWLVYIEYWRGDHRTFVRCAATLVDSRHIITAAHCIRTPKFTRLVARLGEYDLSKVEDCVDGVCADKIVRIDVEKIIVHPGYDGKSHDIAVLKLAEDAPYTDFIRPICLPAGELQPDTMFAATGWGEIPIQGYYSTTKKIIPLPLWGRAECKAAYSNLVVPENTICAGGEEGIDTCRGDSGGPLVRYGGRAELWGVTSTGNSHCGTKGFPGIYTDVAVYLQWVKDALVGALDDKAEKLDTV